MVKNTSKRTAPAPQPQPTAGETAAAPVSSNVVKHPRSEFLEKQLKDKEARSQSHQPQARQLLAQAADLMAKEFATEKELAEIEDRAAILLYMDRANGAISSEVVTETIGDVYGWRLKGTTEQWIAGKNKPDEKSKTPFNRGEALRKRIVRAVQAREYVTGENETAFFKGLPKDDIRDILQGMEKGDVGFWAAYEKMGEIKRNHRLPPLNPLLNPLKVAEIAKGLQADGMAKAIANNPALNAAYVGLYGVLVETYREIEDMERKTA